MTRSGGIKPAARLYVEAPLGAGGSVALKAGQVHYLRTVLRLEPGHRVLLFNGRDGEWLAELALLDKKAGAAAVLERRRAQEPEPDVWLLFAPIKGDRIDFIAEKATELGAARLQPVITRHTVVNRVNADRLAARAIEAAEQCERLTVPEVMPLRPLRDVLQDWPPARRLFACAEAGLAQPLAEALLPARGQAASWGVLTGPEGGFAPDELDLLSELSFVTPVGLGPRLLRADTAALAALAVWQALLGDGSRRPPARFEN